MQNALGESFEKIVNLPIAGKKLKVSIFLENLDKTQVQTLENVENLAHLLVGNHPRIRHFLST